MTSLRIIPRLSQSARCSVILGRSSSAAARQSRCLHSTPSALALQKFQMPAMSPTMTEGGIAQWKVKEGDSYSAGDVLLEIETDKATMDVEAQDDGILAKIIAGDGSKAVQVNAVIAITAEEGDDLSKAADFAAEAEKESASSGGGEEAAESKPKEEEAPKQQETKPSPSSSSSEPKKSESKSESSSSSSSPSASASSRGEGERIFASPLARRLAQERGIPLAQIQGSGPNGRIIKEDIEKYKEAPASAGESAQKGAKADAGSAVAAPQKGTSAPSSVPEAPHSAGQDYTDVPVSSMRRIIAGRLTSSKQELPHYYVSIDIEMDRTLKLRELFNSASEKAAGGDKDKAKAAKLSVGDFITKAAGVALREVPEVNTAWYGDFIRQHHKADISIAVATPTGLITPIVRDVGSQGLSSISAQTKALASKARANKLQPHEYQGGSFTISNMGMFGISHFTAIINPPQAAILAIGGTERKVLPAAPGAEGEDGEQVLYRTANVMQATISADHRVVDGATAARWMKAFKDALENPLSFML